MSRQASAVRDIEAAKRTLCGWDDTVSRCCVPSLLLPGGLEGVEAWVRCWRAIAYAVGASETKNYVAEGECYMAAADAARIACQVSVSLPCPRWRQAVLALHEECRAAAAVACGKNAYFAALGNINVAALCHPQGSEQGGSFKRGSGVAPATVGKALGALKHVKGVATYASDIEKLTESLESDNNTIYFAEVETHEGQMPTAMKMPDITEAGLTPKLDMTELSLV